MAKKRTHVFSVLWENGTCSVLVYPYKPDVTELFYDIDAESSPYGPQVVAYTFSEDGETPIHLTFNNQSRGKFLCHKELNGNDSENIVFDDETFVKPLVLKKHMNKEAHNG